MAELMERQPVPADGAPAASKAAAGRRGSGEPRSAVQRRQRLMLGAACTTAVLSTAGLIASTWVRSPAEVAAQTEPPKASVLTAPVESKALQRTVILRGRFSSARTLTFAPSSALSPDGTGGSEGGDLLVTRRPRKAGDEVRPGMLLAEVSYRPVFALHGRIPALRDLVQGMRGRDVAQLQDALAELGYSLGPDTRGRFGAGTAAAVRRHYSKLGYAAPTAPGRAPTKNDDGARSPGGLLQLPKSEVMFVPSFPARVVTAGGSVGRKVSDDLLELAVGGVRLTGHLDPSEDDVVKPGQNVQVVIEESGDRYRGAVAEVGDLVTPKASGKLRQPPYIPVAIRAKGSWKPGLNGQDARITITAQATEGNVLAVPLSAVNAPADGRTSVTVISAGGDRRRVRVKAGMSADGFVEVAPEGGALREGDQVVVGR
ncbi:peptidoglycan-binding protein [Spirillospora sp. NPDC049024]